MNDYPRPGMRRKSFYSLNGKWEYQICKNDNKKEYVETINVPYSPESVLSGVNKVLYPSEELWYRKKIKLPNKFSSGRIILHFGAVDQICEIFIDNTCIYKHIGGYTSFEIDITDKIKNFEFQLEVKVKDYTEQSELSRGKQSLNPKGIWYKAQSGIWQTVWIENVPNEYIQNVRLTPNIYDSSIDILVNTNGSSNCIVEIDDKQFEILSNEKQKIRIENPKLWTPNNPYLYNMTIKCNKDVITTYFGFRSIEIKQENGISFIYLNGNKTFLNGILEQGYYKNGLYTATNYNEIYEDLKKIKKLGFNTVRKHVKIEPDIYYYYCDKIGLMVMQDMVNGGGTYNGVLTKSPLFFKYSIKDHCYKLLKRTSINAKKQFEEEIIEIVKKLYNFPSIIIWTIFNEGWGQYDSTRLVELLEKQDPTRLIEASSGWFDQKKGDIKSDHCYFKKYIYKKDKYNRAVILSEYGGFTYGKGKKYTYRNFKTKKEYIKRINKCIDQEIMPNICYGLCGSIYTQYNDIENEKNGLVDSDRNLKIQTVGKTFKKLGDIYEK